MADNEFNLVTDTPVVEFAEPVLPESDEELESPRCEDCGYPMKEDWRTCPKCGKVVRPFDVWEVLATVNGAPTKERVEQIKAEKGLDVRLAIMDEDRVYLIIPILRDRWRQFNAMVKNIKDDAERQDKLMDLVVTNCVIWPKPDSPQFGSRAFTNATLFEQIMHISDFIPPQIAVQMVYKL